MLDHRQSPRVILLRRFSDVKLYVLYRPPILKVVILAYSVLEFLLILMNITDYTRVKLLFK